MTLATVIGATGHVGSVLTGELLRRGWDVAAPSRTDRGWLQADQGVLFYCAGLTADFDARPFDTVEAHVTLLAHVVESGRFRRLVYLSSTRLYDGLAGGLEDSALRLDPTSPRHLYDLSKALGENLTLTRSDGRGAVARLANVYGWEAEAGGFLSDWLRRAGETRDLHLASSPHVRRDYIHVSDVATALIAMAEAAEPPGIVNVAQGELVANSELAKVFEGAGWRVVFGNDGRPADPPAADTSRLRALGIKPQPVQSVIRSYLEAL